MAESRPSGTYVNKVVYGNEVLIDLTADTVTAEKILRSYTAHDKSGAPITGACDFDVNSQEANVTVAEILEGKTAFARGAKLTGTMPNRSSVSLTIDTVNGEAAIPQGYHDGGGKVKILEAEQAKLIAANIKKDIVILGVKGTLEPSSDVTAQEKTVTPATTQQVVLPDEGYDYLSQVTVAKIPYVESENAAGGFTVTIGATA